MKPNTRYIKMIMSSLCRQPRVAGTTGGAVARTNIQYWYEAMGYSVSTQSVEFTGWKLIDPPKVYYENPITGPFTNCLPVVWSGSTDGEVTGKVIRDSDEPIDTIKTFEAYEWLRYPVLDNNDTIIAYLLANDRADNFVWPQPLDDASNHLPYIIVGTEEYYRMESFLKKGDEIEVRISVKSKYLPNSSIVNVIAQKSNDPRIIVGSHYDSFINSVGAHDNASGTAALLYLAKKLKSSTSICLPHVRYISFDAEKWNKFGSYNYVEMLEESGELHHIKLMVNIDSVGVGEYIYILTSPGVEKTVSSAVNKVGFPEKISDQSSSEIKSSDFPFVEIVARDEFPQFDSWPFMRKGIPVIQIGTRGGSPFLYWHDSRDTLEKITNEGYKLIGNVCTLLQGILEYWVSNVY